MNKEERAAYMRQWRKGEEPTLKQFRIVLGGPGPVEEVTTVVPRDALLENLDYYEKQGRKWVVVKA